tara:strand:+ start:9058 stop:9684 length:627 start_codon:yes stop_codon:yes gene_type:complete
VLILASSSKSRKQLLKNADIQFIQIASSFDESTIEEKNITRLASELSFSKATNTLEKIKNSDLELYSKISSLEILGCDSIFEFRGKAFGKPSNKKEAYERWLLMSSNYGYLHTGHTILFCELNKKRKEIIYKKKVVEVISSKITFSNLEKNEIKNYVDSNEPLHCAGGFALEGRGGKYIEKIEGCFSNVMGLSLPWLRREIANQGIKI